MSTKDIHENHEPATPLGLGSSEGLGPNETLVERLRQERRATAWTRGLDVDYPTGWEPNLLCHEAAAEIVRLRCLVDAVRGAFNRECDDADEILRCQGLEPANCRTDGGSLKSQMVLGALEHRDVMLKREARKVTKGLTVQSDTDGVWLNFAASTGLHALLNVERIADSHGGIVSKALRDWAADVGKPRGA